MPDLYAALEVLALQIEAQQATLDATKATIRPLVAAAEQSLPALPRLEQGRCRTALGRIRHALGIEVRDEIPQVVVLARAIPVVDVGAPPLPALWLLLILDRGRTHAVHLDAAQVATLRALASDDYAHGEVQIWVEDLHTVASATAASGLGSDVVAAALLEGLKHGRKGQE